MQCKTENIASYLNMKKINEEMEYLKTEGSMIAEKICSKPINMTQNIFILRFGDEMELLLHLHFLLHNLQFLKSLFEK